MIRVSRPLAFAVMAVAALFVAGCSGNKNKIVGKWKLVSMTKDGKEEQAPPGSEAAMIEFTADGKLSMIIGEAGKETRAVGTYKLEADKLAVSMKVADKEITETLTIKNLTGTELVTEDSKGKSESLRKKP